jgi:hypothetical protein
MERVLKKVKPTSMLDSVGSDLLGLIVSFLGFEDQISMSLTSKKMNEILTHNPACLMSAMCLLRKEPTERCERVGLGVLEALMKEMRGKEKFSKEAFAALPVVDVMVLRFFDSRCALGSRLPHGFWFSRAQVELELEGGISFILKHAAMHVPVRTGYHSKDTVSNVVIALDQATMDKLGLITTETLKEGELFHTFAFGYLTVTEWYEGEELYVNSQVMTQLLKHFNLTLDVLREIVECFDIDSSFPGIVDLAEQRKLAWQAYPKDQGFDTGELGHGRVVLGPIPVSRNFETLLQTACAQEDLKHYRNVAFDLFCAPRKENLRRWLLREWEDDFVEDYLSGLRVKSAYKFDIPFYGMYDEHLETFYEKFFVENVKIVIEQESVCGDMDREEYSLNVRVNDERWVDLMNLSWQEAIVLKNEDQQKVNEQVPAALRELPVFAKETGRDILDVLIRTAGFLALVVNLSDSSSVYSNLLHSTIKTRQGAIFEDIWNEIEVEPEKGAKPGERSFFGAVSNYIWNEKESEQVDKDSEQIQNRSEQGEYSLFRSEEDDDDDDDDEEDNDEDNLEYDEEGLAQYIAQREKEREKEFEGLRQLPVDGWPFVGLNHVFQ